MPNNPVLMPFTERNQMPSLLDLYQQICTEKLIPSSRQKDFRTALNYLAASYDTTPEKLPLTEAIEAHYRNQLRTYFEAHPKGKSTIRNTIQAVGQILRAVHHLTQTPPIAIAPSTIPGFIAAQHDMREKSPYRHHAWMRTSRFRRYPDQWPGDIEQHWRAYCLAKKHSIEPMTLRKQTAEMQAYIGYHCLTPDARLDKLPEPAREKLLHRRYQDDLREIMTPTVLTSWDELFQPSRVQSFITWHAWRVHIATDAAVLQKSPSRPSTTGRDVAETIQYLAKCTERPEATALYMVRKQLPEPKKTHDKKASYHRFELAELEQVAQGLMAEARRMTLNPQVKHLGAKQAIRFQTGLMLALAWRNPMRARNWCEALLETNLKHVDGRWHWRFEGKEMKIDTHGGEINVFEPDVDPDVAPYLEEYLEHFRPQIPGASRSRHVFPNRFGRPLTDNDLLTRLQVHVYRYTSKRLFTHLLRSLFMTHHLTNGVDINSIAYAMNDMPATVLENYNEMMADKHRPIIHNANLQALANRHKPLTPPNIPVTPKPRKTDPDQMSLL
jgi:hypothetical protein